MGEHVGILCGGCSEPYRLVTLLFVNDMHICASAQQLVYIYMALVVTDASGLLASNVDNEVSSQTIGYHEA